MFSDLAIVESRVISKMYTRLSDFVRDVTKIFDNCRLYNPTDSPFYQCAEVLETYFVQKLKSSRDQFTWATLPCAGHDSQLFSVTYSLYLLHGFAIVFEWLFLALYIGCTYGHKVFYPHHQNLLFSMNEFQNTEQILVHLFFFICHHSSYDQFQHVVAKFGIMECT